METLLQETEQRGSEARPLPVSCPGLSNDSRQQHAQILRPKLTPPRLIRKNSFHHARHLLRNRKVELGGGPQGHAKGIFAHWKCGELHDISMEYLWDIDTDRTLHDPRHPKQDIEAIKHVTMRYRLFWGS